MLVTKIITQLSDRLIDWSAAKW